MWRTQIHKRTKFFLWKLANFGLPVMSNLVSRGIEVECDRRVHGCESIESEVHVSFNVKWRKGYDLLVNGVLDRRIWTILIYLPI